MKGAANNTVNDKLGNAVNMWGVGIVEKVETMRIMKTHTRVEESGRAGAGGFAE